MGEIRMDMVSLVFDRLLPVAVLCCAAGSIIYLLI
jgi:hypothetical protein